MSGDKAEAAFNVFNVIIRWTLHQFPFTKLCLTETGKLPLPLRLKPVSYNQPPCNYPQARGQFPLHFRPQKAMVARERSVQNWMKTKGLSSQSPIPSENPQGSLWTIISWWLFSGVLGERCIHKGKLWSEAHVGLPFNLFKTLKADHLFTYLQQDVINFVQIGMGVEV